MRIKDDKIFAGGAILIAAIVAYFLWEKSKREKNLLDSSNDIMKLRFENELLKKTTEDLKKELDTIIENKDLPQDLKKELKSLIEAYENIDEKVAMELQSVNSLIDIKEESKAILTLAKVIENLLRNIHEKVTGKKSRLKFEGLIEFAKNKKLVNKEEYHFLNALRSIRNEEAHNLGIKKGHLIAASTMMIAFALLVKLGKVIKEKTKKKDSNQLT